MHPIGTRVTIRSVDHLTVTGHGAAPGMPRRYRVHGYLAPTP